MTTDERRSIPLPCPFCGSHPSFDVRLNAGTVYCANYACGASVETSAADLDVAIALWNKRAALPAAQAEPDELGYAQRLATALWEKHWKADAPEWKPLPDTIGVLTQIDNMTVGLVRKFTPCPGCDGHDCDWEKGICAYPGAGTPPLIAEQRGEKT